MEKFDGGDEGRSQRRVKKRTENVWSRQMIQHEDWHPEILLLITDWHCFLSSIIEWWAVFSFRQQPWLINYTTGFLGKINWVEFVKCHGTSVRVCLPIQSLLIFQFTSLLICGWYFIRVNFELFSSTTFKIL